MVEVFVSFGWVGFLLVVEVVVFLFCCLLGVVWVASHVVCCFVVGLLVVVGCCYGLFAWMHLIVCFITIVKFAVWLCMLFGVWWVLNVW